MERRRVVGERGVEMVVPVEKRAAKAATRKRRDRPPARRGVRKEREEGEEGGGVGVGRREEGVGVARGGPKLPVESLREPRLPLRRRLSMDGLIGGEGEGEGRKKEPAVPAAG